MNAVLRLQELEITDHAHGYAQPPSGVSLLLECSASTNSVILCL
ncbi:SapB/AmfS family lanthipeptide [Saccharopolyspora cebuensis]|uniref:SapB/AmfS family lanthipeptide n=1 Tax=Saccharopolyspora cebuensis TaxID=418759 RepID=A0ABV4CRU5_9PSEU